MLRHSTATILGLTRGRPDHVRLGFLAQEASRYEEAEAHYVQALKEGDSFAHNNLGTLYVETGRLELAEEQFRLGANKRDAKALKNLRLFFEEGGRLPGIHPSPNIQEHPVEYEIENRAADPEGKLEAAMWQLAPWSRKVVLDVGCGAGFHLARFAAKAARVIGVEPHGPSLVKAKRRVSRMANVTLHRGSAERLPLPDGAVDVAHARFAYFFGAESEPGLAELERVMRQGGTAFIIDNDWNWGEFAQWLRRSAWTKDHNVDETEAFWVKQRFHSLPIRSEWRFDFPEDFERVVRIEFPEDTAGEIIRTHSGTVVTYGYLLRYRRYSSERF